MRVALLLVAVLLAWAVPSAQSPQLTSPVSDATRLAITTRLSRDDAGTPCDIVEVRVGRARRPMLLVSVDMSGRLFCNSIVLADRAPFRFIDAVVVWQQGALADVVRDYDGDGNVELLVNRQVGSYGGAVYCTPTVQVVYSCTVRGCTETTDRFPQGTREAMERLEAWVEKQRGVRREREDACESLARDWYRRRLLLEPRAGFDKAREWMTSDQEHLREKAAIVFDDIGTPEAAAELKRLSLDSSPVVADVAQRLLQRP